MPWEPIQRYGPAGAPVGAGEEKEVTDREKLQTPRLIIFLPRASLCAYAGPLVLYVLPGILPGRQPP